MNELWKKIYKNKDLIKDVIEEEDVADLGFISTGVISVNLLFSGRVQGGIPEGKLSLIAAPKAQGKSLIGYSTLRNAQKKGKFCVIVDAEIAFDYNLARKMGILVDKENLMVIQTNRIEEIQKHILAVTDSVEKHERKHLFFLVDSLGAMVTSKTMEDAASGKDVSDMTESKKKNKLAKVCMGLGATFFVINHVYDNVGGFGDPLAIPGGRGFQYMAHCIVMGQTKAKDKDSEGITGCIVSAKTVKSRFGKEESKLKFRIKNDGGLDIFFGLLEDAIEGGYVKKEGGWVIADSVGDTKKYRESAIYTADFWLPIFNQTNFGEFLEDKYSFKNGKMDVAEMDITETIHAPKKEDYEVDGVSDDQED